MAHKLAVIMKEINVEAMLRKITAKQWLAWEAYLSLEPTGSDRLDWMVAAIRERIHNTVADKKHQLPLKDFLLKFEDQEEKKKQSVEDQIWIAYMWANSCTENIKND